MKIVIHFLTFISLLSLESCKESLILGSFEDEYPTGHLKYHLNQHCHKDDQQCQVSSCHKIQNNRVRNNEEKSL